MSYKTVFTLIIRNFITKSIIRTVLKKTSKSNWPQVSKMSKVQGISKLWEKTLKSWLKILKFMKDQSVSLEQSSKNPIKSHTWISLTIRTRILTKWSTKRSKLFWIDWSSKTKDLEVWTKKSMISGTVSFTNSQTSCITKKLMWLILSWWGRTLIQCIRWHWWILLWLLRTMLNVLHLESITTIWNGSQWGYATKRLQRRITLSLNLIRKVMDVTWSVAMLELGLIQIWTTTMWSK